MPRMRSSTKTSSVTSRKSSKTTHRYGLPLLNHLALDNSFPLQRDGTMIEKFELCDFRDMYEFFESQRAAKKALSAAERKALKAEKDKLEEPFTTCVLDGRKEKVGNFRVEPPGLFRGRGEHPRKGSLKVCRSYS